MANTALAVSCEPTATTLIHPKPVSSAISCFNLPRTVPGMHAYAAWVTPPVALFLGLAFALLCGQAHPKFNKKTSKYLLQYSVVGLGFGMNLQASLASGREGMEFTIISIVY